MSSTGRTNQGARKSMKGQQVPNFTEDQARDYFERLRWPNGPACVHCGSVQVYVLGGEATRPGLFKCRDCKGQFSVTVDTVMEDSHLSLSIWAKAFHLMASSKKGMSALQLQRNLGLGSYRTAWHLAHRIRYAMQADFEPGMLKGTVEGDETYIGGKPRPGSGEKRKRGFGTPKQPVMVLVSRDGKAHSAPIQRVNAETLREALAYVDPQATVYTDELPAWGKALRGFKSDTVNHGEGQYAKGDVHTNTAESFFSLMKRGVYGTFHHISVKHMHRYCDEFAFRWSNMDIEDAQRRDAAVQGFEGKRLFYKSPVGLV